MFCGVDLNCNEAIGFIGHVVCTNKTLDVPGQRKEKPCWEPNEYCCEELAKQIQRLKRLESED